uniref:Uncharacterized protein n=1 Tax=Lepeophtheirus salmonis TaxID=72036 RepID=A0A0K2TIN8_LEPSM
MAKMLHLLKTILP